MIIKMKNIIITILFLIISCSKFEMVPTTAEEIMNEVKSRKKSKAVLLNIWATTCAPCVAEFPMIINIDRENNDLDVIFVSTDFNEDQNKAISFLESQGMKNFSYIKNQKDQKFINGIHREWSGALPFTIVFGKDDGEVVDFWEGKEPKSRFTRAISLAIKN